MRNSKAKKAYFARSVGHRPNQPGFWRDPFPHLRDGDACQYAYDKLPVHCLPHSLLFENNLGGLRLTTREETEE